MSDRFYGARISASKDSPEGRILERWKRLYTSQWGADRPHWSSILRSIILRYDQMLSEANPPDPELVLALAEALVQRGHTSLLFRPDYATKADIMAGVEKASHITPAQRDYILGCLDGLSFVDFARLIESVETYVGARLGGDGG